MVPTLFRFLVMFSIHTHSLTLSLTLTLTALASRAGPTCHLPSSSPIPSQSRTIRFKHRAVRTSSIRVRVRQRNLLGHVMLRFFVGDH